MNNTTFRVSPKIFSGELGVYKEPFGKYVGVEVEDSLELGQIIMDIEGGNKYLIDSRGDVTTVTKIEMT